MGQKKTLNIVAYEELKQKILNNEFKPGEHLEEKELCDLLNISRTPIREAINRLEFDNLVYTIPKKGVFVEEMSLQSISELFQARKVLEPTVVMLSAPNLNKDRLVELRNETLVLLEEADVGKLHKFDYKFHEYLNGQCHNRHILRSITYISNQFQRVRTQEFYPLERAINGANEHIQIIDLLLSGNYEQLPQLIEKHIASTESFYFASLIKPNPMKSQEL